MKKVLTLVSACVALLFVVNCFAELPASFNNRGAFEQLRVTTPTGQRIIVKNANIGDGEIINETNNVKFADVNKLENKLGNHSTAGSIWGTVIGCGIGVAVALGTVKTEETMYETKTTIQLWPIYVFGIGGSLVGLLIGSGSPKYGVLYKESPGMGQLENNLNLGLAVNTNTPSGKQTPALTFNYHF